ncbi:MAG: 2-oxoacid:ferredoxin oxidoreductase subunit gamma [Nitrospirae bacterium]|nr:MAG: 2-oxoacid:ferredoxin oxidoreductase subunit gamma [Nitrospirota bacterium]
MEDKVIIAGSGGQGVLLLGRLIATTGMLSGFNVTWFPSYGAEMRGGTANCSVVVSSEIVGSPVISRPDTLIVMNCPSFLKFSPRLQEGGLIIMDSSLVGPEKCRAQDVSLNGVRTIEVPASEIASELGSVRFANMVLFGAYIKARELSGLDTAEEALKRTLPERHHSKLPFNIEAIKRGWEFVRTN